MKRIICATLGSALLAPGFLRAQDLSGETNIALNRAVYQSSAANYDDTGHLATDGSPDTFWQSASGGQQWVYVDLGQACPVDRVQLLWGKQVPRSFKVQLSQDDKTPVNWTDVYSSDSQLDEVSKIEFPTQKARYVRLLLQAGGGCYMLREFEVFGLRAVPGAEAAAPEFGPDGTLLLDDSSGAWRVQREDFAKATPEAVSSPGIATQDWLPGIVPGTVLTSYLKAGAIPDPRYGDQQFQVSEDFFNNHDFWYRREFAVPDSYRGRKVWLNFDGINWKADIYINGGKAGHIDGAFIRGAFDITSRLQWGKPNVLAVLIHNVTHTGPTDHKVLGAMTINGGIIGLDSPTFVASAKWNWIPSIRGRDAGIWSHVYLRATGEVKIDDPFVLTDVSPDYRRADLTVKTTLANQSPLARSVLLAGRIGSLRFEQKVDLAGGETKEVVLDPESNPELSIPQPKLWWPNGYGEQPLYDLHLEARIDGAISDQHDVTFGVRKLTYDTSDNILKISVNGRRILCDGGNWGMAEAMLQYDAQDFDTAIHLHKDMNLVMIRNWVGQTANDEFYQACDKYGILIWNDFWLANPGDGPDPADDAMFIANMRDKILQIRNHPSLALYCGRNEGNPPRELDEAMRQATQELDGSREYIPHSAAGLVTGGGPYDPQSPNWYFENRSRTLHSELGIVCVPTLDTMRLMMPEKDLWPINNMWALHDYHQPRCQTYTGRINHSYGPATGVADFCEKAQMLNMETAKAMMECWRSNRGSGGLIWMSQAAWPSLICQLYDYYLNPTAAYFGVKKACEPLHILWNSYTNQVQVADDTLKDFSNLTAEATVFDMNGSLESNQSSPVDVTSGTAVTCFPLKLPDAPAQIQFIKLKLTRGDETLSDNFYWHGNGGNYHALSQMPRVQLTGKVESLPNDGNTCALQVTVANPTSAVALMVCLKVVRDDAAEDRVLPIYYEDNYISLLPHETRSVTIRFDKSSLGDSKPLLLLQGWNVDSQRL
ncbi:MAG: discoidin domain-containing protein [Chthoniobacteraceae bacterium]|jgi:hypothetical protein